MHDFKLFSFSFTHAIAALLLSTVLLACSSTAKQPPADTQLDAEPNKPFVQRQAIEPDPQPVEQQLVKPDFPDRYVVKKNDTLWDISAKFLKNPWLWPEVWHINSQIRNPHLIYPGDVIVLYYVDGKPFITLEGQASRLPPLPAGVKTVKLSPKIRYATLVKSIDTLPRAAISPFISNPRILSEEEFEAAPYVVSSLDQHLVASQGDTVYVRNVKDQQQSNYMVVRKGSKYVDPDTDEVLGYEAIDVADARMVQLGDPASIILTRVRKEVLIQDVLIPPNELKIAFNFYPRAPSKVVEGKIIAVFDGLSRIGQYQVVVLNRGEQQGIEHGHVLAIYQAGDEVFDYNEREYVVLPEERSGLMIVFRVFERVSYALVMEAARPMRVLDAIRNP